jgi:hypothetical protein
VAHEVDPGSPVGSSCDQPVDTTLGRPVTPDGRQPGAHRRRIREQSLHEATELLHTRLLHRRDPGLPLVASTLVDHAAEGLDLAIGGGHHGIEVEEVRKEGPRGWTWLLRCCEKQACRAQGGSWGRTALVLVLGLAGRRRGLADREPGACLPPQLADVARRRAHASSPSTRGAATEGKWARRTGRPIARSLPGRPSACAGRAPARPWSPPALSR